MTYEKTLRIAADAANAMHAYLASNPEHRALARKLFTETVTFPDGMAMVFDCTANESGPAKTKFTLTDGTCKQVAVTRPESRVMGDWRLWNGADEYVVHVLPMPVIPVDPVVVRQDVRLSIEDLDRARKHLKAVDPADFQGDTVWMVASVTFPHYDDRLAVYLRGASNRRSVVNAVLSSPEHAVLDMTEYKPTLLGTWSVEYNDVIYQIRLLPPDGYEGPLDI